jgi:hypothetical protein
MAALISQGHDTKSFVITNCTVSIAASAASSEQYSTVVIRDGFGKKASKEVGTVQSSTEWCEQNFSSGFNVKSTYHRDLL